MPDTDLEDLLRADLRARGAAAPPAPPDLAARVRRQHRHQRRTRLLVATAAAGVVALFAGVATALPTDRPAQPAAPATTAPRPPTYLEDLPTRGSLASDEAWLAGVRELDWYGGAASDGSVVDDLPAPADRRVLFAGDTPAGRIALLAGRVHGRLVTVWFTGPAGARPAGMTAATSPEQVTGNQPVALLAPTAADPAEGTLVVVTLPGWTVDVQLPPVVDAAGVERLERRRLPVDDGIAVVPAPAGGGWWPRLETSEAGGVAVPISLGVLHGTGEHTPAPTTPADPRGIAATTDVGWVAELAASVLAERDLAAEEAAPVLLAAGRGPGESSVALLGVTFPSGATGAWLASYTVRGGTSPVDAGGTSLSWYATAFAPAGTPVDDRLLAVPVDGSWLVVSGPQEAVAAEVVDRRGTVVGVLPLRSGAGSGALPEGVLLPVEDRSVRLLDAGGSVVAAGPLTPAEGL
ncbi:hypothetical protein OF117_11935 [Geodermatophilus sp. YIM 151500]|uniref:hypothetical protein n=1 Tax=Geodermatophilus sp. YIM 151500 TaxID=2984531 RepID=UPI0021E4EF55|nr:hypothetical protein [Geodermatophilus sp. YIM 151500]MCV2490072.1 hypothetical protein [Geodermatophilus sp. YIM 151500]